MAVEESIKIKIQANAEEFKIVSNIINAELGKLGKNFEILEGNIKQTSNAMKGFDSSSKKFNKGIMSISLILQDLPYGFRGIQNNIPALAQGFGVLYLAVSAVTAAMTYFVLEGDNMSKGTKKLYDTFKDFINGVVNDLVNALYPAFKSITESIKFLWNLFGENIIYQFKAIWDNLLAFLKIGGAILANAFQAITSLIKGDWSKFGESLLNIFKLAWNAIIQFLSFALKQVGNGVGAFVKIFNKDLGTTILNSVDYTANEFSKKFKFAFKEVEKAGKKIDVFSLFGGKKKKGKNTALEAQIREGEDIMYIAEKNTKEFEALEKAQKEGARRAGLAGGNIEYIQEPELDPKARARAFADKMAFDKKMSKDRVSQLKEQYQLEVSEAQGSFEQIKIAEENMRNALNKGFMDGSIKLSEYLVAINELRKKSNKTVSDEAKAAMDDMVNIGIGIMNALGPSLDMLLEKSANIGEVLSKALSDVFKKLVKVALAAAVAVGLMAILFPKTLAKAGGALTLFGNLTAGGMGLGNDLFKPTANGGVFAGPSYRLVGEYPGASSNPEVVAPLDKLKDMIGSGGGTLETRISGNDLLILVNKANRNNSNTF